MAYPNPHFDLAPDEAWAIIQARSFGTLVGAGRHGGLRSAQLPVTLDRDRGWLGCHLAANNPLNDALYASQSGLLIVSAGDAYIQPSWYGLGPEQVPTWLHIHVEAAVDIHPMNAGQLTAHLVAISKRFEPDDESAWHPRQMTRKRFDAMQANVRGYRLSVTDLRGQKKLGQNKPAPAIRGMTRRLRSTDGWSAQPIIEALEALPANR